MNVTAIIAAAGSGTRLGACKPKALVELAGEPLLVHAVRSMREAGVEQIVVTTPADDAAAQEECAAALAQQKCASRIIFTPGGGTRQESVARGLDAALANFPGTTHVLIHDAARALTPADMIKRVTGLLAVGAPAVIPVVRVIDTIKRVCPDPDAVYTEEVLETLDRSSLRAVQTPQGFDVEVLRAAHQAGAKLSADELSAAPDDAALVEMIGRPVSSVPGDSRALKITTPFDLELAHWLLQRSARLAS